MSFDDTHELYLVRRTLNGDHEAFGALILIYERPLLAYVYSILRDREYTRDVVQEVFTSAYCALPHWKPPVLRAYSSTSGGEKSYSEAHPLSPWLYRIATNKALNFLQKKHLEQASLSLFENLQSGHITPEERYLMRELLQEVLHTLSEEDALCIVLRFCCDEPYSEIAEKSTQVRRPYANGSHAV